MPQYRGSFVPDYIFLRPVDRGELSNFVISMMAQSSRGTDDVPGFLNKPCFDQIETSLHYNQEVFNKFIISYFHETHGKFFFFFLEFVFLKNWRSRTYQSSKQHFKIAAFGQTSKSIQFSWQTIEQKTFQPAFVKEINYK